MTFLSAGEKVSQLSCPLILGSVTMSLMMDSVFQLVSSYVLRQESRPWAHAELGSSPTVLNLSSKTNASNFCPKSIRQHRICQGSFSNESGLSGTRDSALPWPVALPSRCPFYMTRFTIWSSEVPCHVPPRCLSQCGSEFTVGVLGRFIVATRAQQT